MLQGLKIVTPQFHQALCDIMLFAYGIDNQNHSIAAKKFTS